MNGANSFTRAAGLAGVVASAVLLVAVVLALLGVPSPPGLAAGAVLVLPWVLATAFVAGLVVRHRHEGWWPAFLALVTVAVVGRAAGVRSESILLLGTGVVAGVAAWMQLGLWVARGGHLTRWAALLLAYSGPLVIVHPLAVVAVTAALFELGWALWREAPGTVAGGSAA